MSSQELFYPDIAVSLGSYLIKQGIEVEIYSEQSSYFDWAKIRFTPEFQEKLVINAKAPCTIWLGYSGQLEPAFEGYVSKPYSQGDYKDEIVLKDKMILLDETFISNTFVNVTPQEIIAYCLLQAGIKDSQISASVYQTKKVVAISRKNVISVIKEIDAVWGIKTKFFFSGGIFYWGEKLAQQKIYHFVYGVNIIRLDRPLGTWELETVSVPFIKHSHKIRITHPKITGEFEVKKIIFKTNETGFIRSYIYF